MPVFDGSRYTKTTKLYRSGTPYLSERARVSFTLSKCKFYTFIQGDTVDGLAYKFYNNAQLWWAIMDANRQYLSEVEIKPGDILAIPNEQEVKSSL